MFQGTSRSVFSNSLEQIDLNAISRYSEKIGTDFNSEMSWEVEISSSETYKIKSSQLASIFYIFKRSLLDLSQPTFLQFCPDSNPNKLEEFQRKFPGQNIRVINLKQEEDSIAQEKIPSLVASAYRANENPRIVITKCFHLFKYENLETWVGSSQNNPPNCPVDRRALYELPTSQTCFIETAVYKTTRFIARFFSSLSRYFATKRLSIPAKICDAVSGICFIVYCLSLAFIRGIKGERILQNDFRHREFFGIST